MVSLLVQLQFRMLVLKSIIYLKVLFLRRDGKMKRTERIEKEQARKKRIKEMAVRYCQGESLQSIASSYGISRQAVS